MWSAMVFYKVLTLSPDIFRDREALKKYCAMLRDQGIQFNVVEKLEIRHKR